MEHSWLLKIHEASPPPAVENTATEDSVNLPCSKKGVVREFTNYFESFNSNPTATSPTIDEANKVRIISNLRLNIVIE